MNRAVPAVALVAAGLGALVGCDNVGADTNHHAAAAPPMLTTSDLGPQWTRVDVEAPSFDTGCVAEAWDSQKRHPSPSARASFVRSAAPAGGVAEYFLPMSEADAQAVVAAFRADVPSCGAQTAQQGFPAEKLLSLPFKNAVASISDPSSAPPVLVSGPVGSGVFSTAVAHLRDGLVWITVTGTSTTEARAITLTALRKAGVS